jgi:hypothetical protein
MSSILRLAIFPFRPARIAEKIRQQPSWAVAYLVLAGLTVLGSALLHPAEVERTLASLPPTADAGDRMAMRQYLDATQATRLAFVPVRLLMGWSATALGVWVLVKAFHPPIAVRFRQMFALEVHAEAVIVAALVLRAVLVITGAIADAGEEVFPLNALMLVGGERDYILHALLTSINLHTLWYVWVVGHGISVLCGYTKSRAFFFSAATWAMALGLNLAILRLLQGALHLFP